jgi:hypothetical protein
MADIEFEEATHAARLAYEEHFAGRRAHCEANRRYREKLRLRCLDLLGDRCRRCRSTRHIEFAHIKPTGLRGRGRGLDRRYRDILANPDCYLPLCHDCHLAYTQAGDYREIFGIFLEEWLRHDERAY